MDRLGLEFISVFGMPPVAFVEFARDLGVRHITTGLQPMDYNPFDYPRWSLRDAQTRREMIQAMDDCGVSLSGGEGILVQPGADARAFNIATLELMAELGARRVNSVSFEPDFQRNVDQYGVLAETAAAFGIEVMLEFVPIFAVADLATADRIVQAVGRPDLRLMVDTMHVARCGATVQDLAALEPHAAGYIQLCDCPVTPVIPDYMDEAMHQRLAPGDGELPLREMLAALPRDRIVGIEIPLRSEAVAGVPLRESLGRCVTAARSLLAGLDG